VSLNSGEINKLKSVQNPSEINFVQISKDFGLHKPSVASMTRNSLHKRVTAADMTDVLDNGNKMRNRTLSSFIWKN
jgi:hypothetical protein